jgi:hypothetical protein
MYWYSIESSLGRKYGGSSAVDRLVGDLVVQVQPVAQRDELVLGHLLDLVRGVAALEALAERPALDGLGEDHRGGARAQVLGGGLVGGVELAVVVAAAGQVAQVVVGQVRDDLAQARIGSEEVLTDVLARLHRVALELAVDGVVHLVEQHAVLVLGQQLVPLGAPDDLDDVPAGAAEHASSSWMILPLPRTGPSRRWRLQLTTKTRLSSRSRLASEMAPSVSGSSVSPSPRKPTPGCRWCRRARG